jgi:hypothetical protein
MPKKMDPDTDAGTKVLRVYRKLMGSPCRLYQAKLAEEMNCSSQTIGRIMETIADEVGPALKFGTDCRRRWYQMQPVPKAVSLPQSEELRYLQMCKDLSEHFLGPDLSERIDKIILNLSLSSIGKTDPGDDNYYAKIIGPDYTFFAKGRIDYGRFVDTISKLEHAAEDRVAVTVSYYSPYSDKESNIKCLPLRFAVVGSALYLVCAGLTDRYDFTKLLTLAIHRIKAVKISKHFISKAFKGFDTGDFSLPWQARPSDFRIVFKKGPAVTYIIERTFTDDQKTTKLPGGSLLLTFKSRSLREVVSWCRSFGEELESLTIDGKLVTNIMTSDMNKLFDNPEDPEQH